VVPVPLGARLPRRRQHRRSEGASRSVPQNASRWGHVRSSRGRSRPPRRARRRTQRSLRRQRREQSASARGLRVLQRSRSGVDSVHPPRGTGRRFRSGH
jgi:hypothetical protein